MYVLYYYHVVVVWHVVIVLQLSIVLQLLLSNQCIPATLEAQSISTSTKCAVLCTKYLDIL